ncbi:MAG TPA: DNA-directed RNA polymerase subunit beta, partial [Spirochaetia bacterium]|nr:DNA-directed RNA polymerase subunit beta [Spirochaetia bacterium]
MPTHVGWSLLRPGDGGGPVSINLFKKIKRHYIGSEFEDVMEIPNLVNIQTLSYERFLQREKLQNSEPLEVRGLEEVFQGTFPIESPNEDMVLEYCGYTLDESYMKFSEQECKHKGITYSIPIKAKINLVFLQTGEIRQKEIYMGDIPLMTDRGTFIINGAERVVVSQIHRSPGVIFSHEKGVYSSRIIPYRGSWLEFEIDQKRELIYAKIDRKKRILATMFLRALGYDSREKIIDTFYKTKKIKLSEARDEKEKAVGSVFAKAIFVNEGEAQKKIYRAGEKIHPHDVEELLHLGINKIEVIDFTHPESLHTDIILSCFEREEMKFTRDDPEVDEPTREEAISRLYSSIFPGEPITIESAEKDLQAMFFSTRRYDLGRVGRYKLTKKFDYKGNIDEQTLVMDDIINTMKYLIKVYIGEENVDDIDHLGNRRVRSVGELLANQLKIAFSRMERIAKERMSLKEVDTIKPQELVSIKPIVASIKEFFGSSQLSQFMDQVNPLAELTHKRRLNALGPGGLSRDRAGFEVRDVHYTHYGRMCPIETPEGPNIGLIVSLANYTRVNEYGFLESPYRKVVEGKVTKTIEYLSAIDEDKYFIAQATTPIDREGKFLEKMIPVRKGGDYNTRGPKAVQYMDVSPKQIVSVSASLIPFLEHDDANRALMGSNMQRQAVPLYNPEPPRVGTGMEGKTAYDSGVVAIAKNAGVVEYVSSTEIRIRNENRTLDSYSLIKYQRTNQDTCFNQRPIVRAGQHVKKGEVIADGPATTLGELALGRNVLVAFMPWNGYNYEDAILVSERIVKEDMFSSIHIQEFVIEVRETKLGPEKITRDIPNISEQVSDMLDDEGIIQIG